MYRHQQQVREFHEKYEVLINEKPTVPNDEVLKLRCKLLLEEVLEFCTAAGFSVNASNSIQVGNGNAMQSDRRIRTQEICGVNIPLVTIEVERDEKVNYNLVEMADALADIQVINDGTCISLGIDLEPLSDEVHRSNMTKLWSQNDLDKAAEVDSKIDLTKDHIITNKGEDQFLVKRLGGKVIKSPSYSPADIKTKLIEQGAEL
jgi:predicted HAD superfamily Cof-like phosphohydrolase